MKHSAFAAQTTDLRKYQEDGVVCLRQVIDPYWIPFMQNTIDEYISTITPERFAGRNIGGFLGENIIVDVFSWLEDDRFKKFLFESNLASIAGAFMQSKQINLYQDNLIYKLPGCKLATPWHMDLTGWGFSGQQACNIWVPFDPITSETGGMEFVRGSHLWGKLFGTASGKTSDYLHEVGELESMPDIEGCRDQYDIIGFFDMQPGDCLIFSALTLHGAKANLTPNKRRALSTRWLGDDIRYNPKKWNFDYPFKVDMKSGDKVNSPYFPLVWQQL